MRKSLSYFFIFLIIMLFPSLVIGASFTASFSEVFIQNLRIGQPFSTTDQANLPYVISNKGAKNLEVKIEVVAAPKENTREGYEPIPDILWVRLERNFMMVKPGEQGATNIVITVPNEEKYKTKKYQVILYAYTIEGSLQIGLKSNLFFTVDTATGPYPIELMRKNFKDKVTFTVQPEKIYLDQVKPGKQIDVQKATGAVLKITNTTDQECIFVVNSMPIEYTEGLVKPTDGYILTTEPSFLTFDKRRLIIPAKGSEEVKMYFKVPKDKKYAGQKYIFVAAVRIVGQSVSTDIYTQIYVSIKK